MSAMRQEGTRRKRLQKRDRRPVWFLVVVCRILIQKLGERSIWPLAYRVDPDGREKFSFWRRLTTSEWMFRSQKLVTRNFSLSKSD
jgi:hypothetical protein